MAGRGKQWKDHRRLINAILWKPRTGAPARRGRMPQAESCRCKEGVEHPADEVLGRSRRGLGTTLDLACDGAGRPLSVVLTPASATRARS
jgi:hypothetical protein